MVMCRLQTCFYGTCHTLRIQNTSKLDLVPVMEPMQRLLQLKLESLCMHQHVATKTILHISVSAHKTKLVSLSNS